jgi:hypothetical protein
VVDRQLRVEMNHSVDVHDRSTVDDLMGRLVGRLRNLIEPAADDDPDRDDRKERIRGL